MESTLTTALNTATPLPSNDQEEECSKLSDRQPWSSIISVQRFSNALQTAKGQEQSVLLELQTPLDETQEQRALTPTDDSVRATSHEAAGNSDGEQPKRKREIVDEDPSAMAEVEKPRSKRARATSRARNL